MPVVTDAQPGRLAPGDTAPGFTLPSDTGETVSLADFRGRKVIVYFYPAAMTPGCTTEACDFTDSLSSLKEQERIVLTLYYFEELKLHEIADVLELTESRVSQIRAKALGKLRVELTGFRQRVA